jgi:hypothetical protein
MGSSNIGQSSLPSRESNSLHEESIKERKLSYMYGVVYVERAYCALSGSLERWWIWQDHRLLAVFAGYASAARSAQKASREALRIVGD